MSDMKQDLKEIAMAAFMLKKPLVIVEGIDDIKFYTSIASLNALNIDVRAVETIDGYSEGCEHVIKSIQQAEELIKKDNRIKKYVLGIIDRDVRQYKGTLPNLKNIIILKYYSYESHLITDNTIKAVLHLLTSAPTELITKEVIEYLKSDFSIKYKELYYISLEALKGSCDALYNAKVNYGANNAIAVGRSKDYIWSLIGARTKDLDRYAAARGITKKDIRYIAKGKWYLRCWCHYLVFMIYDLHKSCGKMLPKCEYCRIGRTDKCLWRNKAKFDDVQLESILCTEQLIDMDETSYIAEELKMKLEC